MEQNKPAQTPVAKPAEAPHAANQQALALTGVTIQAPKAIVDFSAALGALVKAGKDAFKDGFQVGQDLPVLITAAIADLGPIVSNAPSLIEAFKEQPVAAAFVLAKAIEDSLK